MLVYGIVFTMGIYYINRLIALRTAGRAVEPPDAGTPVRPLSSAVDAARESVAATVTRGTPWNGISR